MILQIYEIKIQTNKAGYKYIRTSYKNMRSRCKKKKCIKQWGIKCICDTI